MIFEKFHLGNSLNELSELTVWQKYTKEGDSCVGRIVTDIVYLLLLSESNVFFDTDCKRVTAGVSSLSVTSIREI